VIALRPDSAAAFNNRSNALLALGQPEQALASCDRAIALRSDYAAAFNNRGNALLAMRRPEQALASCDRAIALQPDYAAAFNNRGNALLARGQPDAALASYDRAIALDPANAQSACNRSNALLALERYDQALASCDQAIALKLDYEKAWFNRGVALQALGRYEQAFACYDRTVTLAPDHALAHNRRGNTLALLGRLDEAVVSLGRAIALKPDLADAFYDRGTALLELKRLDEAVADFDRAIALRPDHAPACYNRGNALLALGRLEQALASFDWALALRPDHAFTQNNRGNVLKELGRLDEALASFDRVLAADPGQPEIHYNRANTLHALGRLDEALESFAQAIALKPDYAGACNNMGNVLKELGRLDEARAAYAMALAHEPGKAAAAYANLAEAKTFIVGDADLAAMQALDRSSGLAPTERIQLDFALAKGYADIADHQRAFQHLLRGNALKRAQIDYDEPAIASLFERVEAVFTPELMARFAGGGDRSAVPVFVLGMPRSGTTLVEQILASHPQMHGAGEVTILKHVIDTACAEAGHLTRYPDVVAAIDGATIDRIGASYVAALRRLAPGAARVSNKMPSNYFFVGLIHLALPNAFIIHTVRDPLDTCVSCFSKLFTAEQNHTYDLAELGRYYRRYQALMAHWRRVLPPGRILEVRYEDTVLDFENTAKRIVDYCGLGWDARCLDFHRTERPVRTASAAQVRRPIYRDAIGRWRHYGPHLGPLLDELGR
jgi:tetratricopeptide (TPR) repeat protein